MASRSSGFGRATSSFPAVPSPFLPAERRLIEVILEALDLRFRGLFDPEVANRIERFHYAIEDLIVTDFLDGADHFRIPAALEALRVAALSTYENRRVSLGTLLLGTPYDPAAPDWVNPEGAPRFNTRLTAIKGFHRLCDGVQTLFLVDQQGELTRTVDIGRWAEKVHGSVPLETPCPRGLCEPCQGDPVGRPHLPGADPLAGDQGLRRGGADVRLQRCAMAAPRHPDQVRDLVQGGRQVVPERPCGEDLPGRA